MNVFEFTLKGTSDEIQAAINADELGELTTTLPWQASRGFEGAASGDGAIIKCSEPGCKCCWIGDIEDVETQGPGYPMTFLIGVR